MTSGFDKFLDSAGKTMEVFPKVYDDGLQPAVKETGKILERIPKAINAAFEPLDRWIAQRNFNLEETKQLLAEKLKNKNSDDIVPPEPYVAVPALQAISYSMSSDELRNLYANLLAKSMQKNIKDTVHPSFVEIIKQLSPYEAHLLSILNHEALIHHNEIPIVAIYASTNREVGVKNATLVANNILESKFYSSFNDLKIISSSIDNLERLKLATVDYRSSIVGDSVYDDFKTSSIILQLQDLIKSGSYGHDCYEDLIIPGHMSIPVFGMSFIDICIKD